MLYINADPSTFTATLKRPYGVATPQRRGHLALPTRRPAGTRRLRTRLRQYRGGLAFDRYGQAFATDGAGGEGVNYVIPGAATTSPRPAPSASSPASTPAVPETLRASKFTSGSHLPPEWQGNLHRQRLPRPPRLPLRPHRRCGSGYASREQPELIKTTHPAFRPIDVKMGPDGALYIADWYNPIIQHGEVDFVIRVAIRSTAASGG
jgi:hypothetical protein